MMSTPAPTRPLMRYHGGKWRLAPWIISQFPTHRVYVEPYGGAASVLIRKPRSYAEVYNDRNSDVVHLFRVLRSRPADLAEAVRWMPYSREEYDRAHAAQDNPPDDPIERAALTLLLAAAGFGTSWQQTWRTGFRANTSRAGTTPAHDWRAHPGVLAAVAERLRGVIIEHDDALAIMERYDSAQTLHYLDPPYVHAARSRNGAGSYRHEMTDADHVQMLETCLALRGHVVVSGYASAIYDDALRGWHRLVRPAKASGQYDRLEVLWLKPSGVSQPRLWEEAI